MRTKTFDALKLVRELRDALGEEMEQMTPEERVRYIRERAASSALGKKIAEDGDDGTERTDVTGGPSTGR